MREWLQNYYNVVNKDKYIGNTTPFYRSSWELRFMTWCDHNNNVIKWASESIKISYILNENGFNKNHTYIPDFYLEVIDKSGKLRKMIVEIKPEEQGPVNGLRSKLPEPPKNKNSKALKRYYNALKTYKKNATKWAYAEAYCERNGLEFIVLTKKDIFN